MSIWWEETSGMKSQVAAVLKKAADVCTKTN